MIENRNIKPTIIATSGGSFGERRDAYLNCNLPDGVDRYPCQTDSIDQLILQATGKAEPRVCCLMTASDDPLHNLDSLIDGLKERFGRLGGSVRPLRLTYYAPDDSELQAQLGAADVVYVSGGNSDSLNRTLRQRGADKLLVEAAQRGAVLSGSSAGLCCWFSDISASTGGRFITRGTGLGWFRALIAPHWDKESHRHRPFHKALLDNPGLVGLAFDDCTAIEIRDDEYRLHQFDQGGQVKRGCYDQTSGDYSFDSLEITDDFKPLADLGIMPMTGN